MKASDMNAAVEAPEAVEAAASGVDAAAMKPATMKPAAPGLGSERLGESERACNSRDGQALCDSDPFHRSVPDKCRRIRRLCETIWGGKAAGSSPAHEIEFIRRDGPPYRAVSAGLRIV
jgi:hypothetical protein